MTLYGAVATLIKSVVVGIATVYTAPAQVGTKVRTVTCPVLLNMFLMRVVTMMAHVLGNVVLAMGMSTQDVRKHVMNKALAWTVVDFAMEDVI